MKTSYLAFMAACCAFNAQAYSNFMESPYTPYPPGCVTLPDLQSALYGDNVVKVFEGEKTLRDASKPASKPPAGLPVNVAVYRVACAEENRSVILVEFSIPERLDPAETFYVLSRVEVAFFWGVWDWHSFMQLSAEPNGQGSAGQLGGSLVFGGNTPGMWDGHERRWTYVLNSSLPPSRQDIFYWYISPETYNEHLRLWVESERPGWGWTVDIPPTAEVVDVNPRIPLSGRLSGNWIFDGASDQGISLAISEVVGESVPEFDALTEQPLLLFLSWFTFDTKGDKLWLTGAVEFPMGASEVIVPIEDVSEGQFLGGKTAQRSVVGSVTLTGNSCNDLAFQYDLSAIGLGTGTQHLRRLYSLETAGYACRDYAARIQAK